MPDRAPDALLARLQRRGAFGGRPLGTEDAPGLSYDDALDALLAGLGTPLPPDPEGFDPFVPGAIQQAWLERMHTTEAPLAERLTFFWHGHFATSNAKVQDAGLMWDQMRLFREHGHGRFADLVRAVVRDPAMLRFLDGDANRKGHPNENLGRELMELFTLGVGHYDETDVREVARALTGHGTRGRRYRYVEAFHDEGEKHVLGRRGAFDADEVVEILCASTHCHRFLAVRLLRHFGDPTPEEIERIAGVLEREDGHVGQALDALFRGGTFRRPEAPKRVRAPVELLLAGLAATGARQVPAWAVGVLARMGQSLFRPPSVKGWPEGELWLSASGLVARLEAAERLASEARDVDASLRAALPEGESLELRHVLRNTRGRDRLALVLASPEFQLS